MKKSGLHLLFLSIVIIGPGGCSGSMPAQITSLNVDCKTEDIEISNETVELNGEERWTAKCGGKTYYCTYLEESRSDCYEVAE